VAGGSRVFGFLGGKTPKSQGPIGEFIFGYYLQTSRNNGDLATVLMLAYAYELYIDDHT
jgi:hypothetical protein